MTNLKDQEHSSYKERPLSAKMDQLCDDLRDCLNTIEGRLKLVEPNIPAPSQQVEKSSREKLDDKACHLHQLQRKRVGHTWADLVARAEQKISETKEAFSEWKSKREAHRLNAGVDRAKALAANAVDYALATINVLATIDEAEEAIFGAAVAAIDGPTWRGRPLQLCAEPSARM